MDRGSLSVMERLCILSFLKNGHEFHLYTYGDVAGIPQGTTVRDGREILGEDRIFTYKNNGSYAGFSNLFRYKLLLEKGGYWVDMDIICLRPFDLGQEHVFSGAKKWRLTSPFRPALFIQNCVIKAPPGSKIMKYCYEVADSKNPADLVWGETGPNLLDSAVHKLGMVDYVSAHGAFTTIDWPQWNRLISSSPLVSYWERLKIARLHPYAIHLYNEMWRQGKADKNGSFPKNCIYELMKKRYLNSAIYMLGLLLQDIWLIA